MSRSDVCLRSPLNHEGSSELGELGRGKAFQARYDKWMRGIKEEYGSTGEFCLIPFDSELKGIATFSENYLIKARLPWESVSQTNGAVEKNGANGNTIEECLKFDIGQDLDPDLYAVLPNDWPYDVPKDVEHVVVWSKVRSAPAVGPRNMVITSSSAAPDLSTCTRRPRSSKVGSRAGRWFRRIHREPKDRVAACGILEWACLQQSAREGRMGLVHRGRT